MRSHVREAILTTYEVGIEQEEATRVKSQGLLLPNTPVSTMILLLMLPKA